MPKDGTAHGRLSPPASFSYPENVQTYRGQSDKGNSSIVVPLFPHVSGWQPILDITDTNICNIQVAFT